MTVATKKPARQEYERVTFKAPSRQEYEKGLEKKVVVPPPSRPRVSWPEISGPFDVWAAPPESQIWKSPGADYVREFGQGWVEQTQIPALMGKKLPPPKTIAGKAGRLSGQMMEAITELIGMGAILRGAGFLGGKIPKGAALGRALRTGLLFGTQQVTEEARKATAEAIYDEDFGSRGGMAVLESVSLGVILSLAGSGIGRVWSKLRPSEQAQALKTLGLKRGASLHEINKAARREAFKYHPDKVKGMREQFEKVIDARNALRKAKAGDVIIANAKQNFKKQLMFKVGVSEDVANKAIKRLDAGESIEKVDQMLSQAKAGIKPLVTAPTIPELAPRKPVALITPPEAVEVPPGKEFVSGEIVEVTFDGKTWLKRRVASGMNVLTEKPIEPIVEIGGTVFADGKSRTMVNIQGQGGEIDSFEIGNVRKAKPAPTPDAEKIIHKVRKMTAEELAEDKVFWENFDKIKKAVHVPTIEALSDALSKRLDLLQKVQLGILTQQEADDLTKKFAEAAKLRIEAKPEPVERPVTIINAAIRLPSGIIYTGTSHPQIANELINKGIEVPATEESQGFETSEKIFVNRKEAGEIARKAGQLKTEGEVFAHDFGPFGIAPEAKPKAVEVAAEGKKRQQVREMTKTNIEALDENVEKCPRCTNETLEAFGIRKPKPVIGGLGVRAAFNEKGFDLHPIVPGIDIEEGTKLSDFIKAHQEGSFYIMTNEHSMALIDGKLTDFAEGTGRRKVVGAFEILPSKAQPVAKAEPAKVERKLIKDVEKEIVSHDIYQSELEAQAGIQEKFAGQVFVPQKYAGEVKEAVENYPALKFKITHDPKRGKHFDELLMEIDEPDMDISDLFEWMAKARGVKAKIGKLNKAGLDAVAQTGNPYDEMLVAKYEGKLEGLTNDEINDNLKEIALDYGMPEEDYKGSLIDVKEKQKVDKGVAEKGEKKKEVDLLGRPILKGGVAGKQAAFLEKEDYRLREPDIEGQMKLKAEPGEIPPRPLVNPKASALQQDKQLRKQQVWDKKYGKVAKPKGKPGFIDVRPLLKIHKTFMGIVEPSKAVELKLGKEPYAVVIKGVHEADVGRIEFNEAQIEGQDKSLSQLSEWFNKFSNKDLKNFMISRGTPRSEVAQRIQYEARGKLPKELKRGDLFNAAQRIADQNYKYLQSVVGDDIHRVEDYFYGIWKNPKKVDKLLDYWHTTKRFTKEKKLPTVADALDYDSEMELRSWNPIENLKAEYIAISHLKGMNWMKDELLRTGKGKFIDETSEAPLEWDMVQDPVFKDLRLQPDLAKLINNLIANNKITRIPILNTLREINNVARTVKFVGSAFHLLSVAKQSVADSGYFGFLYKKTALRGFTRGFRANDPIFRTTAYKDYVRHGGGHRYSVESEARRTFNRMVNELNRNMGVAVKAGALPLKIPLSFVNWMFQSYIPKVKYSKYLDVVAEQEKKLGRVLTSPEKIDIIKEGQNFYGMMNERTFGRSGTVTTATRFYFMSPGYAEGNYRTKLKAAIQWGGKGGFNANRSRSNIINSWLITGTLATVGTLAFTGKPPKKPETLDDARDLFKIDTGKMDEKGRRIMIDLMTYDKDYWNVAFNILRLRPDIAIGKSWKRIGGMKAPMADIIHDLVSMSMGKAIYDWKGDRVMEITDPFLLKAMKLTTHEIKKLIPISVSVFQQSKKRDIDTTIAAIETLLGFRPTKTEQDIREQKIISKMYSLAGQREEMSYYIGQSTDPKKTVAIYNKTVNNILNSPYVPKSMKDEWSSRLLVDYERVVTWKRFPAGKMTDIELNRAYNAHTLSVPYKRRGEPFRMIGEPKKGSERRVSELKAEAQKRGIELKRGPRKPPRR